MGAPYCIGGEGACPPEDVGGMHGYREMLEVFEKPGSKEQKEYRQWLGLVEGEKWDARLSLISLKRPGVWHFHFLYWEVRVVADVFRAK